MTTMKRFFQAPVFEDEEKTRVGQLFNGMSQIIFCNLRFPDTLRH